MRPLSSSSEHSSLDVYPSSLSFTDQRIVHSAQERDALRIAILRQMAKGEVTDADVVHLRRASFAGEHSTQDEAEALFTLERAPIKKCSQWAEFFIASILHHVVWNVRPTGIVRWTLVPLPQVLHFSLTF
jgi:hypothetical protein